MPLVIPKPSITESEPSLIINETAAGQQDTTGADKVEALAITLQFKHDPTDWYIIINSIQAHYNQLQELVAAYYMAVEKKDAKTRIKEVFKKLTCTEPEHILDSQLR